MTPPAGRRPPLSPAVWSAYDAPVRPSRPLEILVRRAALALATVVAPALALALGAGPAAAITNGAPTGTPTRTSAASCADQAYSDGTWIYCSGTLISPDGVPHGRALRRGGRRPRPRQLLHRLPGRRRRLRRHLPRATRLPAGPERPARHRRRRARQGRQGHHPGRAARGRVAGRPAGHAAVHLGRLRRLRGRPRPRAPAATLPLRRRPRRGDGHAERDDPGLAADLDEPLHRQRRHLLRRLRRPELPRHDDVVAATTITGDTTCRSTNVDYRLDTPSARAFLSGYVRLP